MKFGEALDAAKGGAKISRGNWNGKNMFVIVVPGSTQEIMDGSPYALAGVPSPVTILPHLDMYTAQGEMLPGWLASQSDMLADDWFVVNTDQVGPFKQ